MTCTATISSRKVELLQFFEEAGTRNEMFFSYFNTLVEKMKKEYPEKHLMFVLDNLWAHKSSLIMKIMNCEDRCSMLLTPSNSPELSPIENMFSCVKKMLRKEILETKELYALKVSEFMFSFE